jgi:spoIIIJ-associated protein
MSIPDKIEAAKKVEQFLRQAIGHGGFQLKYRITVDPQLPDAREWERPEILVELAGPDSDLLLERGAELLRAFEYLAQEILRLPREEHEKLQFDCRNYRSMRLEELRLAAAAAAERVRKTGRPYEFAPMSSRERRILHLSLREEADLRTESSGEPGRRHVVVYPKQQKPAATKYA